MNWSPSPRQVEYVTNLFRERVPVGTANRDQFWANIKACSSNESLTTIIDHLNSLPKPSTAPMARDVHRRERLPMRTDIATEPGLYRDPEDGTLYRLGKRTGTFSTPPLSVYSNKAVYRRLTPEGRMVKKGKWTRLSAHQTRQMLAKSPYVTGKRVLAVWLMDEEEKLEWAVGFCLMCSRPLIDAISVFNSIGPDCAEHYHITRQIPPEA